MSEYADGSDFLKKTTKKAWDQKNNGKPRYRYKYTKKMRIIVAEDHKINQKLIQRILQTAGYAVDMVDNCRDAMEFEENLKQLENYLENIILSIPGIGSGPNRPSIFYNEK